MRAAAVLRVSSAGQADPDKDSIPGQRRLAEEWCRAEGWSLVAVYDETAEKGFQSGRAAMNDRPFIQEMLRDARAGLFDVVIFREPSRLGRDDVEALVLGRDLRASGVLVGFSYDRRVADIEKPNDRLLFYLGQWQADMDWGFLTRRMHEGKVGRARLGYWPSGWAPYGYRLTEDKRLEVQETEAEAIRDAFRMLASGLSMNESVMRLNLRHDYRPRQRSRSGTPTGYTTGALASWLDNEAFIGRGWPRRFQTPEGEVAVRIPAPAIMDEDLWRAARAEWQKTRRRWWSGRREREGWRAYPLTGHLFHRHPDGDLVPMSGQTRSGGGRIMKCNASLHRAGTVCPGFGTWRQRPRTAADAAHLEAEVLLAIASRIITEEAREGWRRERQEAALRAADVVGDLDIILEKLAALEAERERVKKLYVRGLLDDSALDEMLGDVEGRERFLQAARAEVEEATATADLGEGFVEFLLGLEVGYGDDLEALSEAAQRVLDGSRPELDRWAVAWLSEALEALRVRVILERDGEATKLTAEAMDTVAASTRPESVHRWLWEIGVLTGS